MSEREDDDLELAPPEAAALRQALRRFDAPAGFTDRVMARALAEQQATEAQPDAVATTSAATTDFAANAERGSSATARDAGTGGRGTRGRLLSWPEHRLWVSGLIAAALVAGVFEGEMTYKRVREQQRRIQQATQQFQTTERITLRALSQAREQLQRAGVPLNLD